MYSAVQVSFKSACITNISFCLIFDLFVCVFVFQLIQVVNRRIKAMQIQNLLTFCKCGLKPWPNGVASRRKLKLGSTCDFVWPGLACTCVDLR